MFIPPSVMEGSKPEYRPEPFAPAIPAISVEALASSFTTILDSLDSVESQVLGGQSGTIWPVKTFEAKLESIGEIIFMVAGGVFGLWWCLAYIDLRPGLFLTPLFLWTIVHYLRSLARKISPDKNDSIRLDTDQLYHDRGDKFDQDGIRYEQICAVKLAETKSNVSGSIEVIYYPYADHTGALNLTRLKSHRLPVTEDNEGLYNELRRRAFGPPPSRQAQIKLSIWQVGRVLGGVLLYMFIISRLGR